MARGIFRWAAAEREGAGERDRRGRRSAARPLLVGASRLAAARRAGAGARCSRCSGAVLLVAVRRRAAASALPDGEDAVDRRRPTRSSGWIYPFAVGMAFFETTIPPVTLVFPGEWAVMLVRRDGGRGRSRASSRCSLIVWLVLGGRRLGHLRARPPAGAARSCCARAAGSASPRSGSRSVDALVRPLRRRSPRASAGCFRWRGRSARSSPARRSSRTAASCPGTCSAACSSRSSSVGLGYVFYRSYDEVAETVGRRSGCSRSSSSWRR